MKLIIAIIQDTDTNTLSKKFIQNNIPATKLSTTGGFLKSGNTTFMIGIKDDKVDEVLDCIKSVAKSREVLVNNPVSTLGLMGEEMASMTVPVSGATVFVLDVAQFERF